MELKSLHQLTPVCLDRFDTQVEALRHVLGGMPFGN